MEKILAIYGSPRRKGNTTILLDHAVQGALDTGAQMEKIVLRDLKMSPCLEIYGCKEKGRCVIQDDLQKVYDQLLSCDGLMLASSIFFYTVSAHTKILMDRCQSLWARSIGSTRSPMADRNLNERGFLSQSGRPERKGLSREPFSLSNIFWMFWMQSFGKPSCIESSISKVMC